MLSRVALGLSLLLSPLTPSLAQSPEPSATAASHKVLLKVLAKGSGRVLKRVEVKIGTETLMTGPDGTLSLEVPDREGSIQIVRQGYEALFVPLAELRKSSSYDAYLLPGKPDDSEVVITGQRRPEVSRKTISIQETNRIAPGGDPAQITQLLPGVQSSPASNEVVIRGSGPNDSRYFVDDIFVPGIFHQVGDLSIVPPNQLSDVEFNSGGFGAQYGDATGGIIVLRSSDAIPDAAKTELTLNVPFYVGAYHERPLSDHSSMAVSVRKSLTEAILPKVLPKDLGVTIVPLFADIYGRYLWKSESTQYKLTAIGSLDGVVASLPSDASSNENGTFDLDFKDRFAVIGLERDHNLGEGWRYRSTPQLSYSRVQFGAGRNKLFVASQVLRMPTEFQKRLGKGRSLFLGFNPEYVQGKVDITLPAPSGDPYADFEDLPLITAIDKFSGINYAAWSSIDLDFDKLVVTPGLRLFKTSFVKDPSADPRLQMRYALDENQSLKFAMGQYSISPEPQETDESFGDPKIGFERSNHYVLGWETKWSERWVTEFQTFYKKTYKLIVSGGPDNYLDTGTRQTYGAEAFIRRNLTEKFFGWIAYTYSVSREKKADQNPWFLSQFDQTHIMNVAGSYKLTALWDLGLRFKFNTASPYTPVSSAIYNPNIDKYTPVYDTQNPNSARAPSQHYFDIFASYDSLFDTYKIKYQFGIQYLALQKRVDGVEYNFDYSEKEEISQLPPIPYIQITGVF